MEIRDENDLDEALKVHNADEIGIFKRYRINSKEKTEKITQLYENNKKSI
jgi:hypothetical protein